MYLQRNLDIDAALSVITKTWKYFETVDKQLWSMCSICVDVSNKKIM